MLPKSMYATHSDGLVHIWRNKVTALCSGASRYSTHICSRCSENSVQVPPFWEVARLRVHTLRQQTIVRISTQNCLNYSCLTTVARLQIVYLWKSVFSSNPYNPKLSTFSAAVLLLGSLKYSLISALRVA